MRSHDSPAARAQQARLAGDGTSAEIPDFSPSIDSDRTPFDASLNLTFASAWMRGWRRIRTPAMGPERRFCQGLHKNRRLVYNRGPRTEGRRPRGGRTAAEGVDGAGVGRYLSCP